MFGRKQKQLQCAEDTESTALTTQSQLDREYNLEIARQENLMTLASQGMSLIKDIYAESKRTEQIKCYSQVKLAEIAAKYQFSKTYLEKAFAERGTALGKHYELLDKAMASNDRELIVAAMRGIGNIVTSSPLKDLMARINSDDDEPLFEL